MSRYYGINWNDINFEAQQRILESVKEAFAEKLLVEGEELLKGEWNLPKPANAKEAYVRFNIREPEEGELLNWVELEFEEAVEKLAEDACWRGAKYLEIEVEI